MRWRNAVTGRVVTRAEDDREMVRSPRWHPIEDDPESTHYDPGWHSVREVRTHLDDADETERERVLAVEADGKARSSILRRP